MSDEDFHNEMAQRLSNWVASLDPRPYEVDDEVLDEFFEELREPFWEFLVNKTSKETT